MSGASKYSNRKIEVDGIVFDSKKEAKVYSELKCLLNANEIKKFERQVTFTLIPSQKINGKIVERPVQYKADFVVHHNDGETAVIDAKGMRTPAYVIKRKLMLQIHGIRINEV